MNITTAMNAQYFQFDYASVRGGFDSGKDAKSFNVESFSLKVAQIDFSFQSTAQGIGQNIKPPQGLSDFIDYDAIGYTGKPIENLTQSEAKALVAEDGFFGVGQTAQRIAGFVISGAGEDLEKLQEGRKVIIQGFEEAESIWGGKLFDISYETINKALEAIDERIKDLGGNVLDTLV
jgi:hypothetical protein